MISALFGGPFGAPVVSSLLLLFPLVRLPIFVFTPPRVRLLSEAYS